MSFDTIVESILSFVALLFGIVIKGQNDRIKSLEDKHDGLPEVYARRDDVREMFSLVRADLNWIKDKLDGK